MFLRHDPSPIGARHSPVSSSPGVSTNPNFNPNSNMTNSNMNNNNNNNNYNNNSYSNMNNSNDSNMDSNPNPTPSGTEAILDNISRDLNRGSRDHAAMLWGNAVRAYEAMKGSPLYRGSHALHALGLRMHDFNKRIADVLPESAPRFRADLEEANRMNGMMNNHNHNHNNLNAGTPPLGPVRKHRPDDQERSRVLREEMDSRNSMREEEGDAAAKDIKPVYSPYANDQKIFGGINGGVGRPASANRREEERRQQQWHQQQQQQQQQLHGSPFATNSRHARAPSQTSSSSLHSHYTAEGSNYGSMRPVSPGEPGSRGKKISGKRQVPLSYHPQDGGHGIVGGQGDFLHHDSSAPLEQFVPKKRMAPPQMQQSVLSHIVLRDDAEPDNERHGKKRAEARAVRDNGDILSAYAKAPPVRPGKLRVNGAPTGTFNLNPALDESTEAIPSRKKTVPEERRGGGAGIHHEVDNESAASLINEGGYGYHHEFASINASTLSESSASSSASSSHAAPAAQHGGKRLNHDARKGALGTGLHPVEHASSSPGGAKRHVQGASQKTTFSFLGEKAEIGPEAGATVGGALPEHASRIHGNPSNKSDEISRMLVRPRESVFEKEKDTAAMLGVPWPALGMSDGTIPDVQISSTTAYSNKTRGDAARLNSASAWIADHLDGNQHIEINLGEICEVYAIATQGAPHPKYQYFVTGWRFKYADPRTGKWQTLQDDLGRERVFAGNSDCSSASVIVLDSAAGPQSSASGKPVPGSRYGNSGQNSGIMGGLGRHNSNNRSNSIGNNNGNNNNNNNNIVINGNPKPIVAQYVRIYANNWNNGIGMRCELFGKRLGMKGVPVIHEKTAKEDSLSHMQYGAPSVTPAYDPYAKKVSATSTAPLSNDVAKARQTSGTYSHIVLG